MTVFLAVDPGVHGALVLWDGGVVYVWDMPVHAQRMGARNASREMISERDVYDLVAKAEGLYGATCLVHEDVGGMPGQSAAGAFTFGHGVGGLRMAAMSCNLRVEKVKSAIWKRALRVPADKRAARARASELMPQFAHLWPLKSDDGRAEAAMIGMYAERFL